MLAVGLGLLILGAKFEASCLLFAFGSILFLATFVMAYAAVFVAGAVESVAGGVALPENCDWPLILSIALTIVGELVLAILFLALAIVRPVLNFVQGFTLGALAMLVLFVLIEQSSRWSMLLAPDHTPLFIYLGCSAAVAVAAGIIAIFLLPLVGILLRCSAGGWNLAMGIAGIYGGVAHTAFPRCCTLPARRASPRALTDAPARFDLVPLPSRRCRAARDPCHQRIPNF